MADQLLQLPVADLTAVTANFAPGLQVTIDMEPEQLTGILPDIAAEMTAQDWEQLRVHGYDLVRAYDHILNAPDFIAIDLNDSNGAVTRRAPTVADLVDICTSLTEMKAIQEMSDGHTSAITPPELAHGMTEPWHLPRRNDNWPHLHLLDDVDWHKFWDDDKELSIRQGIGRMGVPSRERSLLLETIKKELEASKMTSSRPANSNKRLRQ